MGLAAHPTSSQLLVLYEDGALRGYVMSSAGLSSAWGASYFLPGVLTSGGVGGTGDRVGVSGFWGNGRGG